MDAVLNVEEKKIIKQIETFGNKDHLLYGLVLLIPCFMIIGAGIWLGQVQVILAGAITYFVLRLWGLFRQDKAMVHLRSAIQKLKAQTEGANTSENAARSSPPRPF